MSDTGWVSPGTVVSDSSVGTVVWTNPSNATASDNSDAVADSNDNSSLYTTWEDYLVKLVDETGSIVGDNKSSNTELDSSDTYRAYGGSTDKWGETLSVSDINDSDFGVVFQTTRDETETPSEFSEYLKATNFGFSITAGSTINGIEVRVEQSRERINIGGGGMPPVPDDYRERAYVDHIQIKVYYTEGSTPAVGTKYHLPPFKRSSSSEGDNPPQEPI